MNTLVIATLKHFRGLHALVIAGIAVAVAVLAGALLVGSSVRASLRDLALARLGATELVLSSTSFFRDGFADELRQQSDRNSGIAAAAPLLALTGTVTHEESRRTAARVQVFGIDDRFVTFHGRSGAAPGDRQAWMSPGLAAELGAAPEDSLLLRIAKPTDIPLSNLQGRREDVSERIRLTLTRIVSRDELGEFSLLPAQGPILSIFVPLSRLQQDLDLRQSLNAILIRMASPAADPDVDVAAVQTLARASAQLEDLGLKIRAGRNANVSVLENRAGLLPEGVALSVADSAERTNTSTIGALSYLANSIRIRDREIPYSLITAIDLEGYDRLHSDVAPAPPPMTMSATQPQEATLPPIRLNEWAATDLQAMPGDRVDIDYFIWSDQDGLRTETAAFRFVAIVPMSGAGGDGTLTPEYPGITDASDVTSWDPPFPVDLKRVRRQDEAYWDAWRTAPKAFIPLEAGQRLWPSPFGNLSSLRWTTRDRWPQVSDIDVTRGGLTVRHSRAEALAAADGTTDFGEYFIYFSFFLVVAGLLLAGMFFALTVEQRAKELGLLLAVGFRHQDLRRALLTEAGVLAGAGSVLGVAGAVAYAALIMYGLRTWWVGAVGTTALTLHVDPLMLASGVLGAALASIAALWWSLSRVRKRSPRTLLTAGLTTESEPSQASSRNLSRYIAVRALLLTVVLVAAALLGFVGRVAAFFGAGGLLMIACSAALSWWLRRPVAHSTIKTSIGRFGAAYARWRPTRSVLSAVVIAFACFVIVSVGAFRRDPSAERLTRQSGTGGFALMAESVAPVMHNPNTPRGRDDLSLTGYAELDGTHIARFRLRPGDEVSCLTLYQPTNPRIVAPEESFLGESRFSFAQSMAETDAERGNPWLLLNRRFNDGAIPAIADQTSLTYVFHLAVGDDFVFTPEGRDPIRLRIVGTLADSVLQSELIIGESQFVKAFPHHQGYRVWLIEAPEPRANAITTVLEDRLSDFGVDVTDTRARLNAYHQVENTYLSTFQVLGALGLLLGTSGLAAVMARNVLERRRELGLLGAIGFTAHHLRTMVAAESLVIVGAGIGIGSIAALVAIAPALAERANAIPFGRLAAFLVAVLATGLLSALAAIRLATSVRIVEAVKGE
jgi:ABC-type lipoprotein release transport system permease subunit